MSGEATTSTAESFSKEVAKLMGQGRRHLVCSEFVQAVKCFEDATKKLDDKHGSCSNECGEAYLFYGKALLELARAENGVLGNTLQDVVDPKSEESSDDDEDVMEADKSTDKEDKGQADEDQEMKEVDDTLEDGKENHVPQETESKSEEKDKEVPQETESKLKEKVDNVPQGAGSTCEEAPQETESKTEEKGEDVQQLTENTSEDMPQETESKLEEKAEDVPQGTGSTSADVPQETESKTEEKGEDVQQSPENTSEVMPQGSESKTEEKEEGATEVAKSQSESEKSTEVSAEHKENTESSKEGDVEGREGEEGDGTEDKTTEGKQDDEGDLTTMQLAWETLELARIVFSREESREAQLNLAQVYLKLGEIQLEQELFLGAAEEFQKCFDLQQKYLEPDDRLIAETTYNIGLANFLQPNYPNAKEFFSKALKVIDLRITKLEARIAELECSSKGKEKATDDSPSKLDRKELEELRELYPDIKAKVDDAQEMMLSSQTTAEGTTEEGFGPDRDDPNASKIPVKSSTLPVSDVSHLVRRKRKPEEDSSDPANDGVVPLKKARQDEESPVTNNGHVANKNGASTDQQ